MAPKVDQATIIILDIGRNVSDAEKGDRSFFQNARECVSRIIERKIMSQAKNLLGVVLLGSKKTRNGMADQCSGAFRHIEMLAELQTPTWQMIRDLPDQPSNSKGDWLDALVVAADYFKNGVSGVKITSNNVVLVTNFMSPTRMEPPDVEQILNGYKEENFEVDVFGPDIWDEELKSPDIKLARQFVETTNGSSAPFDYTMNYLQFHRKKVVNPMPWNVDLSIGPGVKIPVSCYIRLRDEPIVKNWLKAIKDPVTATSSTSEGIVKNKQLVNTENETVVEPTEVIKGYHYGEQIIPFSECDKSMLYESGEKCLSVYGFTDSSKVTWQNLNGDGLSYVFGRKGDKKAQSAIQCLVECLHELNLVGIVRRVYNKGNEPKMFALMPVIDTNNFICLSMAAINYKEDIKNMAFPVTSLKKYAVTDEQVNAFKDLINAMNLMNAFDETYEESEAFPIAETVSPSAQYVLDCIAYRAMNPGKPLPQPRDELMMLFKQPPMIEKRSREPLEKLKTLFVLNKVEVKTRGRKNNNDISLDNLPMKPLDEPTTSNTSHEQMDYEMPKIKLPKKTEDINRIGTLDPISDFKTLKTNGKTLSDLSLEMTEVIENLVYCNLDGNYTKALESLKFFRSECVNAEPSHYNTWLLKFKTALGERKRHDIVNLMSENALGFILKEENSLSNFSGQDSQDSQMYENDTIPNSAELTIQSEINDMFDEM